MDDGLGSSMQSDRSKYLLRFYCIVIDQSTSKREIWSYAFSQFNGTMLASTHEGLLC
jgi:hypothetical protein